MKFIIPLTATMRFTFCLNFSVGFFSWAFSLDGINWCFIFWIFLSKNASFSKKKKKYYVKAFGSVVFFLRGLQMLFPTLPAPVEKVRTLEGQLFIICESYVIILSGNYRLLKLRNCMKPTLIQIAFLSFLPIIKFF